MWAEGLEEEADRQRWSLKDKAGFSRWRECRGALA